MSNNPEPATVPLSTGAEAGEQVIFDAIAAAVVGANDNLSTNFDPAGVLSSPASPLELRVGSLTRGIADAVHRLSDYAFTVSLEQALPDGRFLVMILVRSATNAAASPHREPADVMFAVALTPVGVFITATGTTLTAETAIPGSIGGRGDRLPTPHYPSEPKDWFM